MTLLSEVLFAVHHFKGHAKSKMGSVGIGSSVMEAFVGDLRGGARESFTAPDSACTQAFSLAVKRGIAIFDGFPQPW